MRHIPSSYPFLQIARRWDVDYGDVLSYADQQEGAGPEPSPWKELARQRLPINCMREIKALCRIPIEQRHL